MSTSLSPQLFFFGRLVSMKELPVVIYRKFFHVFITVSYVPVGSLSPSLFTRLIPSGAQVHEVLAFLFAFKISMGFLSRSLFTHLITRYSLV